MNSFITLPFNETVKNYMVLYSEKMPAKMSEMMGLSQYYSLSLKKLSAVTIFRWNSNM